MTKRLQRVAATGDGGAILLVTLGFLLLFAVFIAALLSQTSGSLTTTGVVRDRAVQVYNVDAGVDYGIMRVRQDGTLCPNAAAGTQSITAEIGGTLSVHPGSQGVTVECRTVEGSSAGANGYAAMLLSSAADALETSNGGSKLIDGPIYIEGGLKLDKPLVVDGDVDKKNSCSPGTLPPDLTVKPPGRWSCVTSRPAMPAHVLPSYPTTTRSKTGTLLGSCNIFKPGLYTQAPDLLARNYFTSGVYVFRDIGKWEIKQADVYGGDQAPGETVSLTGGAPCATDGDAAAGGNGTGVMFIFEGNSRIDFATQSRMELFSRQPPAANGTPGISIYAIPTGDPSIDYTVWKAFSGSASLISVQSGTSPEAAFHGVIYAPTASVTLFATNSVIAQSQGGLVANKLLLISTPSANGLSIAGKRGSGKRVTVIRASAPSTNGGGPAESQAVVEYPNNDVTVQVVRSRRVVA